MDVGDSLDTLKCISILNDIEDINEMQEFRIRDFKYSVDDANNALSNVSHALAENNSFENSGERTESKGNDGCQMRPQGTPQCNTSYHHCHRYMRIRFLSSADFYGRVTIYNFEVHGTE